jgi:hypothetical protein
MTSDCPFCLSAPEGPALISDCKHVYCGETFAYIYETVTEVVIVLCQNRAHCAISCAIPTKLRPLAARSAYVRFAEASLGN